MIQINNMSFSYIKGSNLLRNINLTIPTGAYLSILGENGSCKSTLVKLILGLLKPDCGSIEVDTDKISYVAQRLDNFNGEFPITVTEILT
ncbi:MAG: ATP-binding cassette domain-containing protein, partial [Clostridium sp.]